MQLRTVIFSSGMALFIALFQMGVSPPSTGVWVPVAAPVSPFPVPEGLVDMRYIQLNTMTLQALPERFARGETSTGIVLQLRSGVVRSVDFDRLWVRPSGWALWGKFSTPHGLGQVVFAYRGGYLTGTVWDPDAGTFSVGYAGGGVHRVGRKNPDHISGCSVLEPSIEGFQSSKKQMGLSREMAVVPNDCLGGETLRVQSLMILGTSQAVSAAGGLQAFFSKADAAWLTVNLDLHNSDTNAFLALVHTGEVTYTETGNSALDLGRLSDLSDGYLDGVGALKAAYGADYVSLATKEFTAGYAGMGYMPGAFTVECVDDLDWALDHELGHNFGCVHDRAHSASPGIRSYAYGYRFADGDGVLRCSVMSYGSGVKIPYFSNPDVSYRGVPTGVDESSPLSADNAKVIQEIFTNRPSLSTNQPPSVQVSRPIPGEYFSSAVPITLVAAASDSDGPSVQVDFLIDGVRLGGVYAAPFELVWPYPQNGMRVAQAIAMDSTGAARLSCPVTFWVDIPAPTFTPTPVWTFNATPVFTPDVTPWGAVTPLPCLTPLTLESVEGLGIAGIDAGDAIALSASGRYLVYETNVNNTECPNPNNVKVFMLKDRLLGTRLCFPVGYDGAPADGSSSIPVISPDGSRVAFMSDATNLIPGDVNYSKDLFLYEVGTGAIRRLKEAPSYITWQGVAFSGDGQKLVYTNYENHYSVLYSHDLATDALECVSCAPGGLPPDGDSWTPAFSAGGRYVVFISNARNLVAAPYPPPLPSYFWPDYHVFVRDRFLGRTDLLDLRPNGEPGYNDVGPVNPTISADGRYVAFALNVLNLVPGDVGGYIDVFLVDRWTNTLQCVSRNASGDFGNDLSYEPSLNADGTYLTFMSRATNLVPGVNDGIFHVYRYHIPTGTLEAVDRNGSGNIADGSGWSYYAPQSSDGSALVFESFALNLWPGVTFGKHVYVACQQVSTALPTATPTKTPTISPTPSSLTPTFTPYIVIDDFATDTPTGTPSPSATWTITPTLTPSPTVESPGYSLVAWPNPSIGDGVAFTYHSPIAISGAELCLVTTAYRVIGRWSLGDLEAGEGRFTVDLRDRNGAVLANGLYFAALTSGPFRLNTKVLIQR